MKSSYLVISLDFELLWGVFDKVDPEEKKQYFLNTRKVIPEILDLFTQYNMKATWATVGMLFNKDWDDWDRNQPLVKPAYENSKLSPYTFIENNRGKLDEELVFASDLIELIKESPNQEIGTHTYSHYYCLEKGQNIESFKADLKKAISIAKSRNINIKSLVFPRNQFNLEYLKICKKLGITSVRSNPENWYWENPEKGEILSKIFRTADAYAGPSDKTYKTSELIHLEETPLQQKASRFLRPNSQNLLNKIKLERIKSEIKKAAKNGEIYHLWWHPHNFGDSPENSISDLKEILEFFSFCRDRYSLISASMEDITEIKNTKKYF